jgi:hypothetical protein
MFAPKVARPQTKAAAGSIKGLGQRRSALIAERRDHTETESVTARETGPGIAWDFSKIPIFPPDRPKPASTLYPLAALPLPRVVQPKLAVGRADDPLEREADRVADQVMRMPDPALSVAPALPQISRKCAACEEEEQKLQKKEERTAEAVAGEAPASVREALRSAGQPLDDTTRAYFEPRFGRDFSGVRVHADAVARQSARDVNAHAYTVGHNIMFDAGRFAPGTHEGRLLLAHELTHVVQQGSVSAANARGPAPNVSAGAEGAVQRKVKPSHQIEMLARLAMDGLDDEQPKVVLSAILSAIKLSELPAFAAILEARISEKYGNYFIFLISELEEEVGSKSTVSILRSFADAGVDVTKRLRAPDLQPLAAVAKFKSLAERYKALASAGKVVEGDKQRVAQLIADADTAIRGIEQQHIERQDPQGPQVGKMGAPAAGALVLAAPRAWQIAAVSSGATEAATGIGVAAAVAPAVVIVGAAFLIGWGIGKLFEQKAEHLDYARAAAAVAAAMTAVTEAVEVAERASRRVPQPQKRIEPEPKPKEHVEPIPMEPPEERRKRKCREGPWETLPIKWPTILPRPSERFPLIRTKSGDPNIEPDHRSKPQNDMQKEIKQARQKGVLPEPLCFEHDVEPNTPFDAHHIHPLFLGGREDQVNLCALRSDWHQKGHPRLLNQQDMLNDPTWIANKVCEGNLRNHPAEQEYKIGGSK